jgi:hypothetical protein
MWMAGWPPLACTLRPQGWLMSTLPPPVLADEYAAPLGGGKELVGSMATGL